MSAIPRVLSEIAEFLAGDKMVLDSTAPDGRIASAVNEDTIIQRISEKFNIQKPDKKTRHWWDFAVDNADGFYPVNLKISEFVNANDNLNCKLGIYYSLTGTSPDFPNEIGWGNFFRRLSQDIRDNDKDYYFMVINKQNTSDVLVQGLKTLQTVYPNGNNLPFQCCWIHNRRSVARSFDEARDFLLAAFSESIKKRAKIYLDFQRCFPQYTENHR